MLWTIRETADNFGVAEQTVYTWVRKDQITDCVVRIGPRGRQVRIDSEAIQRFMPNSNLAKQVRRPSRSDAAAARGDQRTVHRNGIEYQHNGIDEPFELAVDVKPLRPEFENQHFPSAIGAVPDQRTAGGFQKQQRTAAALEFAAKALDLVQDQLHA